MVKWRAMTSIAVEIESYQASNAGVEYPWSKFMQPILGQPLNGSRLRVDGDDKTMGDIVILVSYGLESGLI